MEVKCVTFIMARLNRMLVFQESLIGSNCEEFDENSEENKLIYMDIFQVIVTAHRLHKQKIICYKFTLSKSSINHYSK